MRFFYFILLTMAPLHGPGSTSPGAEKPTAHSALHIATTAEPGLRIEEEPDEANGSFGFKSEVELRRKVREGKRQAMIRLRSLSGGP